MDLTQENAIWDFCGVTGATIDQALFFLESSSWQLDAAISSFFDHGEHAEAGHAPQAVRPPSSVAAQYTEEGDEEEGDEDSYMPPEQRRSAGVPGPYPGSVPSAGTGSRGDATGSRQGAAPPRRSGRSTAGRIRTFADLGGGDDDDDDDDDDGPQEYYTGGEKSGMMVQDPNRRNRPTVDSIFDHARSQGAREGTAEDLEPESSRGTGGGRGGAFRGVGRTLGSTSAGNEAPAAAPPAAEEEAPQPVQHTVTFWTNGFTVDDGPLRDFRDPANSTFLASLDRGECPRELAPANPSDHLNVSLLRRNEKWKAPAEPAYRAFVGSGQRLGGSSVDATCASESASASLAVPSSSAPPSSSAREFVLDESEPVTSIQLRLSDGTRMVARFNHHHTVADVRRFIEAARPGTSSSYGLQTMGFPPKQLTDPSQTIKDGGLVNSVIVQR
eukprot:jgi/Mesen1/3246/ME000187S02413